MNISKAVEQKNNLHRERILLGLLPFWTPLIPPVGITCLKSFLQHHGCRVKTFDLNINMQFKEIYNKYFDILRKIIPAKKIGNIYNNGHDLLQNHMMSHFHCENRQQYIEVVKTLIFKNYFQEVENQDIGKLIQLINQFYAELEKYFLALLAKEKPTLLGLSVFRGTLPASLFAFKLTQDNYPHIKTVMGGGILSQELDIESENFRTFLEKTPYIDNIIVGEGEHLFLKYLQGELPGGQRVYSLEDINYKLLDLNCAPVLDFSNFDIEHYPYMATYASRSCPFQCGFCAETTYWGKYRKKSGKQIADELTTLSGKYNTQLFLMCDSLLNPIIDELANEFIKRDISLYWDGYLRVDENTCSPEKTRMWRRGGFYRGRLGIESGSPGVLELMGKKISSRQIIKTITNLAEVGIKTTTYWVIGYPGETEEDFQQTLNLIEVLSDDIYEAECNPFRYFETGQVNSGKWAKEFKKIPLYQRKAKDLLMVQMWDLDGKPSREETIKRVNRFVQHCRQLGIPNPYSLQEIHSADERWTRLHKDAVPSMVELKSGNGCVQENKCIKKLLYGKNKFKEDGDFGF